MGNIKYELTNDEKIELRSRFQLVKNHLKQMHGLRVKDIAQRFGWAYQTIKGWTSPSGENKGGLPEAFINDLCNAYPEINRDYLLPPFKKNEPMLCEDRWDSVKASFEHDARAKECLIAYLEILLHCEIKPSSSGSRLGADNYIFRKAGGEIIVIDRDQFEILLHQINGATKAIFQGQLLQHDIAPFLTEQQGLDNDGDPTDFIEIKNPWWS